MTDGRLRPITSAAAGKLNVLAAGDPVAIERVRPLLDAMAQRTWLLGVEPHRANVAKLAVNFLLASSIEAMAEAATLAERYEIGCPGGRLNGRTVV
jgi:3-hydroxyisobutyrate dehydrogenase-like beta-hydroxyacid dehydrogenase